MDLYVLFLAHVAFLEELIHLFGRYESRIWREMRILKNINRFFQVTTADHNGWHVTAPPSNHRSIRFAEKETTGKMAFGGNAGTSPEVRLKWTS